MARHTVVTMPGDGIGNQVLPAALRVLKAVGFTGSQVAIVYLGQNLAMGLIGAVLLGLGRALGETMAVTMVIGNQASPPSLSLFRATASRPGLICLRNLVWRAVHGTSGQDCSSLRIFAGIPLLIHQGSQGLIDQLQRCMKEPLKFRQSFHAER